MSDARASVTLRALEGRPLRDEGVRGIVIATAHAIAERNGVTLLRVQADDASVTLDLAVGRLAALGFAAELRRLTGNWFAQKHEGASLWGEAHEPPEQVDDWSL